MLDSITYGTFLLFGSLCIVMGVWTVFCVPETKGVRLESIGELFEGNIIRGCIQDTIPSKSRAKQLRDHHNITDETDETDSMKGGVGKGARVEQIEDV
jgi:SP family sugar:H+ symporter-like MFS transporter